MAQACCASSRNRLTITSEINQPTSSDTGDEAATDQQHAPVLRADAVLGPATGAPRAIDARPAENVRTRYSTPLRVTFA